MTFSGFGASETLRTLREGALAGAASSETTVLRVFLALGAGLEGLLRARPGGPAVRPGGPAARPGGPLEPPGRLGPRAPGPLEGPPPPRLGGPARPAGAPLLG